MYFFFSLYSLFFLMMDDSLKDEKYRDGYVLGICHDFHIFIMQILSLIFTKLI